MKLYVNNTISIVVVIYIDKMEETNKLPSLLGDILNTVDVEVNKFFAIDPEVEIKILKERLKFLEDARLVSGANPGPVKETSIESVKKIDEKNVYINLDIIRHSIDDRKTRVKQDRQCCSSTDATIIDRDMIPPLQAIYDLLHIMNERLNKLEDDISTKSRLGNASDKNIPPMDDFFATPESTKVVSRFTGTSSVRSGASEDVPHSTLASRSSPGAIDVIEKRMCEFGISIVETCNMPICIFNCVSKKLHRITPFYHDCATESLLGNLTQIHDVMSEQEYMIIFQKDHMWVYIPYAHGETSFLEYITHQFDKEFSLTE
jgi:hypothetical protein